MMKAGTAAEDFLQGTPVPVARSRAPTGNPTLAEAAQVFFRHWSPRLLAGGLLVTLAIRITMGGWSIWDAVIVAAFIAWEPFQEWLIHVHLLHWRPRKILGHTVDFALARVHRAHHVDPWDVPTLFLPARAIALSFVVHVVALYTLMPTAALATTGMLAIIAIGVVYEWTHYLVHTAYRPRSRHYRKIWQYHRLHHFKNEKYWMGVTTHLADWLLGTMPDPRQVEVSPTARDLGGMRAAEAGKKS